MQSFQENSPLHRKQSSPVQSSPALSDSEYKQTTTHQNPSVPFPSLHQVVVNCKFPIEHQSDPPVLIGKQDKCLHHEHPVRHS
jgi:hypothetical protein